MSTKAQYQSGYKHVHTSIKAGLTLSELESQISIFDFNEFDRGMLDAIREIDNAVIQDEGLLDELIFG